MDMHPSDRQLSSPQFVLSAARCEAWHPVTEACAFQVAWEINPHMEKGSVRVERAVYEHSALRSRLHALGAGVVDLPFLHGAYDSVFTKDVAILTSGRNRRKALMATPRHRERRQEQIHRQRSLSAHGFEVAPPLTTTLEGGDVVVLPKCKGAFLGFGERSDPRSAVGLENFLEAPVWPLQLRDPRLYHLDMALGILDEGPALVCEDALTPEALARVKEVLGPTFVISVPLSAALQFGLNFIQIGRTVLLGRKTPRVQHILKGLGYRPEVLPLHEFQRAGGSAGCLVARVHQEGRQTTSEMMPMRSTSL